MEFHDHHLDEQFFHELTLLIVLASYVGVLMALVCFVAS